MEKGTLAQIASYQSHLSKKEEREAEYQRKLSDLEDISKRQKEKFRKKLDKKRKRLEADNSEILRKFTTDNQSFEQEVKTLLPEIVFARYL
jgi:hypothetical protein